MRARAASARTLAAGVALACAWPLGVGAQTTLSCAAAYGVNSTGGSGTIRRLAAPYTDGAATPIFTSAALNGVNALGVNPTDLAKAYYFDTSVPATSPATQTLYYVDLSLPTPTTGHVAAPLYRIPVSAAETLAFGPDGRAYAYDYATGVLYRQGLAPVTFAAITGSGPSTSPAAYRVNDIVVDAAGVAYAIGLHPAASPTTAHLLRLDPAAPRAEHVRALTLVPATPFPTGSSGLALAPGSTDAAPVLLWSPSTGTYEVNVATGVATRGTSTARADLASCPRNTVLRRVTLDKTWAGASGGEQVSLAVGGGTGVMAATAGSATAGGLSSTASALAVAGSAVALSETFTVGAASDFASATSCTRALDGVAVAVSGGTASVPADSDLSCRLENRQKPRLTLVKSVSDLPGAVSPAASAWTLGADGGAAGAISGASGSAAVTNALVEEGTYTLSESGGVAGYAHAGWACTGATLAGTQISLAAGASATCTVTNTRTVGSLQVVKQIVGEPAGEPWSFTLRADHASAAVATSCLATPLTQQVPGAGGTTSFVGLPTHAVDGTVCTYAVAEAAAAGWQMDVALSDPLAGVTLAGAGAPVVRTVVNRRLPVQPVPALPAWPLAALGVALVAAWRRRRPA
jgi:MYXO-CTERM domain-containing protein